MFENLIPFARLRSERLDPAVYTGPDDVVEDATLTTAEKREILASWASDARAAPDAPTLRRLDSGALVEVDAILEALRGLDRPRGVVVRMPTRVAPRRPHDDDDPPPTPARAAMPLRPVHVDAYGAGPRLAVGAV